MYLLLDYLLPEEWDEWISPLTDRPLLMFGIFLASETFLGLIPLELFIFWAKNEPVNLYVLYVLLLSLLSFAGGLLAFWAGRFVDRIPLLKRLTRWSSYEEYAILYRRWGGIIIILAALTPLPFAMISFLSSSFLFPLQRYLLYASTRFLRFAALGWLLWGV